MCAHSFPPLIPPTHSGYIKMKRSTRSLNPVKEKSLVPSSEEQLSEALANVDLNDGVTPKSSSVTTNQKFVGNQSRVVWGKRKKDMGTPV